MPAKKRSTTKRKQNGHGPFSLADLTNANTYRNRIPATFNSVPKAFNAGLNAGLSVLGQAGGTSLSYMSPVPRNWIPVRRIGAGRPKRISRR